SISTNWPSSRIATLRSWEAAEITNSFDMITPYARSRHDRNHPSVRSRHGRDRQDAPPRACARRSFRKTEPLPAMPGSTLATLVGKWLGVRSQRVRSRAGRGHLKDDSSVFRGWSVAGINKSYFFSGAAPGKRRRHTALAARSVDEAAKPDVHHQANRQKHKQRGGTPVTH